MRFMLFPLENKKSPIQTLNQGFDLESSEGAFVCYASFFNQREISFDILVRVKVNNSIRVFAASLEVLSWALRFAFKQLIESFISIKERSIFLTPFNTQLVLAFKTAENESLLIIC